MLLSLLAWFCERMIALWGDKEEWWHIDKAKEAGLSILGNSYLKIKKKKSAKNVLQNRN
jgi:hypothetical protein